MSRDSKQRTGNSPKRLGHLVAISPLHSGHSTFCLPFRAVGCCSGVVTIVVHYFTSSKFFLLDITLNRHLKSEHGVREGTDISRRGEITTQMPQTFRCPLFSHSAHVARSDPPAQRNLTETDGDETIPSHDSSP